MAGIESFMSLYRLCVSLDAAAVYNGGYRRARDRCNKARFSYCPRVAWIDGEISERLGRSR